MTDDIDVFTDIVNKHHEEVKNNRLKIIYDNALKKSITTTKLNYEKEKLEKPKGYKKIIISTTILLALGFGFKVTNDFNNYQSVYQKIDDPVTSNTNYGDYNPNDKSHNWWYDLDDMATQVLTTNLEYDIDTRIYGCYKAMNPYNKEDYMNTLLHYLNQMVHEPSTNYSKEVISACSFDTFNSYLESKGLNEKEYEEIMKSILIAYGKKNMEEVDRLLHNLNGGAR